MAVHRLKTWAQFFEAVAVGDKRFEYRRNDRGFQRGDTVELIEVIGEDGSFPNGSPHLRLKETGRAAKYQIGYVLSHPTMRDGYVALSLVPVGAAMDVGR